MYYVFYIEIALKDSNDNNIYAFINVSHVPTKKLIEIFNIKMDTDPHIIEGYLLKNKYFKIHKKYILENIGFFDLSRFEYCLRLYSVKDFKGIRKFYKENMLE